MRPTFVEEKIRTNRLQARTLEVCLLLVLASSCCFAFDSNRTIVQFAHTAWGPKDGAPNAVTALAQSADGYLWLGTGDGLYRFDGIVFERYQPQSGGTFPARPVTSLLALPNGDLWIGFAQGLISRLRNESLTNYSFPEGIQGARISGFVQDREEKIWAATSRGLLRLEGDRWDRVTRDWAFPEGPANAVFVDRHGTLWVSTKDTVVFLPLGTKLFRSTGIQLGLVTQFAQSPNGKVWMAETTRSVRPIPLLDKQQRYDDTEIQVGSQGILFDSDGALWITSLGDGLRHSEIPELLRGKVKEFGTEVESFTAKDGLSDDIVSSILQDREGNIWVGTNNGLDRFRKTNLTPIVFPFKIVEPVWVSGDAGDVLGDDNLSNEIRIHDGHAEREHRIPDQGISAYRDPSGAIWWLCKYAIYRSKAGGYTRVAFPASPPKGDRTFTMEATEDSSGVFWLSAEQVGLFFRKNEKWHRLEAASEFAKLTPRTAFTDWMGRVWFGYEEGTILLLKDENIQRVFSPENSHVGGVKAINGRGRHIWVGGELGLAYFDGNSFRRIVPSDAETFGRVLGIEETSNGSVWLAESRGVIQVSASEIKQALDSPSYRVKYRIFDSFDGLPGTFAGVIGHSKEFQGTDGKFWFVASNGIAWADPANVFTNTVPPSVLIRSVTANGRQPGSLANLVLPPRTTDLQINYTALSLAVPEKVHFRYRLDEVDKGWQDAGARREAFYTRLGPGKYHFRVIACNNDGIWNEEGARLSFDIAPAWYQTIWFRALLALAFIALLRAGYQMRVRQLREQEEKFRDAMETMPALAFVADPTGNRTFFNYGWLEYTGFTSAQASDSGWEAAVHPDDLKRVTERWRASQATGEPLDYEARLRRGSDGVYRWFQTRARALRDNRGKIVKWCAVANDIEDRKNAEQLRLDIAHASRVSTMGELVASISHELAQPITVTTAHARASLRWLQRDPPNLTEVRTGTERIIEAGTLAAEIIDGLRSLYKKSPPKRELVAINEVIGEMARMLRTEARKHGVSIRTDLSDGLPMTVADRVQLQQILMNLMLNGIEAMNDTGGVLTVKSSLDDEGRIEISVHDTGPGLPLGEASRIFDAFFTTKPQGSGMGLAICKSIVESHGGQIWATQNEGRGATFHFNLPAAPTEAIPPVNAA